MYDIEQKTIKEMWELVQTKKVNVGMYYQRGLVSAWLKPAKRDALIDSIDRGWNIQPFHCTVNGDILNLSDGKQRLNTICDIMSGTYVPQSGEFAGRTFSMWTQEEKEKFQNYIILLIKYDQSDMPDDDVIVYFERLQKGIPLTATQSKRGQYINKLQPTGIIEMLDIRIELDKEIFNAMARESMALQLFELAMSTTPDFKGTGHIDGFISGDIRQHIEMIKAKLTTFKAVLALMATDTEYKTSYKRILKKVHMTTIAHLMPTEYTEKLLDELNNSLVKFFSETASLTKDENRKAYLTASTSDSASKDQIAKRIDCLKLALTQNKVKPPKPVQDEEKTEPIPQGTAEGDKKKLPTSEEKKLADKAHMEAEQKEYDAKKAKAELDRKANDALIQIELDQLNNHLPEGETLPGMEKPESKFNQKPKGKK